MKFLCKLDKICNDTGYGVIEISVINKTVTKIESRVSEKTNFKLDYEHFDLRNEKPCYNSYFTINNVGEIKGFPISLLGDEAVLFYKNRKSNVDAYKLLCRILGISDNVVPENMDDEINELIVNKPSDINIDVPIQINKSITLKILENLYVNFVYNEW